MKIGGLQKVSLIDYPKKVAAVIFTQGCNFRCDFCHNASLVWPKMFGQVIDEDEVFSFLRSRRNLLDGVVISGGEPTIHHDLKQFIKKIRDLEFAIKLDTNGTNPDILYDLCDSKLLDYIAMDIKHVFEKYHEIVGTAVDIEKIKTSMNIIANSGLEHEFRTTIDPKFHSETDMQAMREQVEDIQRATEKVLFQQKIRNRQ